MKIHFFPALILIFASFLFGEWWGYSNAKFNALTVVYDNGTTRITNTCAGSHHLELGNWYFYVTPTKIKNGEK
jgi:hypothetical protein